MISHQEVNEENFVEDGVMGEKLQEVRDENEPLQY